MAKRPQPPRTKDGDTPRRKRRTGYTASRPSSIDKLPDEIRSVIHRLISGGASVSQITDKLVELEQENAPSRSAVGRYVKNQRLITERLNRADVVARARASADRRVIEKLWLVFFMSCLRSFRGGGWFRPCRHRVSRVAWRVRPAAPGWA